MNLKQKSVFPVSVILCCFACCSIAEATTYFVTDLGDLPGGANTSQALDVNDMGQVVGISFATSGRRGFLWQPSTPNGFTGTLLDLGDLLGGADFSAAFALNDSGQVVGYSGASTGDRAFLWQPTSPNAPTGTLVNLGDLPGGDNESYALGINTSGQVVGASRATTGRRAFLWHPTSLNAPSGDLFDLGDLLGGIDYSAAESINAYGQVVGVSESASGPRAFLWQPAAPNTTVGGLTNLGDLPGGDDASEGFDINSFGQVVGRSWTADGARAFLWQPTVANFANGMLNDFGDLPTGFAHSIALAINDVGQVVGNLENENHGFVWDSYCPRILRSYFLQMC